VRALRLAAAFGAILLVLAVAAAWQVPPHLDWNRYRARIAAIASARMGRPVVIGGDVRLLLLPEAVLVADRVTLADHGDGVSARIGALRLRVALGPLLRGRLVPRRLQLDDPKIVLPWPVPRGAASAVPPGVAGGFSASVEGGALVLGGVELSGINGGIQVDADTGAFSAQGVARLAGLPWRFTALIGAPGRDGISLLTVTLDGQQAALGAGGTLRGRILAGGAVEAVLALRGNDLSRLLPAPSVPWRVQGPLSASDGEIRAPALDFLLGPSAGEGSATLRLGPAGALTAQLHVGRLPLDGWGGAALGARTALPVRLNVSADAASLMGGLIHDLAADIVLGKDAPVLTATAVLPGGAAFRMRSTASAPMQPEAAANATLQAPDVPALLAWVRPWAPSIVDWAALAHPGTAKLAGELHWQPGTLAVRALAGVVDGVAVKGEAGVVQGPRMTMAATLALDRLTLPAGVVTASPWQALRQWQSTLGAPFAGFDGKFDIQVADMHIGSAAFGHVVLQAQAAAGGIALHRLAADYGGVHAELSGGYGRDGGVADGRLDITAADAAAVAWPAAWGSPPAALWHGPMHLDLVASGPPQGIAGQVRGDLGDLRAEAEGRFDSIAPRLSATITIRHPGAPRLLASVGANFLGATGGTDWLGAGSVAVLTHLIAAPGHLTMQDVSIAAGGLRVAGVGEADFSGGEPAIAANVSAQNLVLPALPMGAAPLPLWLARGWHGRLRISADQVAADRHLVATNAAVALTVNEAAVLADEVGADVAGGRLTGQAAADLGAPAPAWAMRFALAGASVDQMPAAAASSLRGGTLDLAADLQASGSSLNALTATMAGDLRGTVRGATLAGIDLSKLAKLLAAHGPRLRAALAGAMAGGDTGPLSGPFQIDFASGVAHMAGVVLGGEAGTVDLSGNWDMANGNVDARLRALPGVPSPPALNVQWSAGKRAIDTQSGVAWASAKPRRGSIGPERR
jgi:hypothetical protein